MPRTLHMSRNLILSAVVCVLRLVLGQHRLFGHMSDRVGQGDVPDRRCGLAFSDSSFLMVYIVSLGGVHCHCPVIDPDYTQYGPQAALIAEAFTPRLKVQRFLAGLSTGVGDRWRASPAYRDRNTA